MRNHGRLLRHDHLITAVPLPRQHDNRLRPRLPTVEETEETDNHLNHRLGDGEPPLDHGFMASQFPRTSAWNAGAEKRRGAIDEQTVAGEQIGDGIVRQRFVVGMFQIDGRKRGYRPRDFIGVNRQTRKMP